MCDGVSEGMMLAGAMTAMSAATTVASISAQQQKEAAQATQNQNIYNNTVSTMDANYNNINLEQTQAQTAAQQQQMQNDRQAAIATGNSVNTAGSMGVSGGSVNDMLGAIASQRDVYDNSVVTNNLAQQQVFNDQRTNVGSQADSTVNALTTPVMPSYAMAGLQIADSGYKYFGMGTMTPSLGKSNPYAGNADGTNLTSGNSGLGD